MHQDHDIEMRLSFVAGEDGYCQLARLQHQTSRRRRFYYLYYLGLQAERHPVRFAAVEVIVGGSSESDSAADAKSIQMRVSFSAGEEGYDDLARLRTATARRKRAYYLYQLGLRAERTSASSMASMVGRDSPAVLQGAALSRTESEEAAGRSSSADVDVSPHGFPAGSKRQRIDFSF